MSLNNYGCLVLLEKHFYEVTDTNWAFETTGQSYKQSMLVIYDSTTVVMLKAI